MRRLSDVLDQLEKFVEHLYTCNSTRKVCVDLNSLVVPDMATATKLSNGMWFVHWTSVVPGSGTFQCGETKLELITVFSKNQVTLSLKEAQGNKSINH